MLKSHKQYSRAVIERKATIFVFLQNSIIASKCAILEEIEGCAKATCFCCSVANIG
jgi:hypothetical protein